MTRMLKAIRLDLSDTRVFPLAAEPDDWVIPGTFAFRAFTDEGLSGKERQAFVSGFLSLGNFGWTTLATPAEIGDDDRAALVERLADDDSAVSTDPFWCTKRYSATGSPGSGGSAPGSGTHE